MLEYVIGSHWEKPLLSGMTHDSGAIHPEPGEAREVLPLQFVEEVSHVGNAPDVCPYLPDRVATYRVCEGDLAAQRYEELLVAGYRRNGAYLYRPVCRECNECKMLRVLVREFHRTKEQRRIWNRGNRTFRVSLARPRFTQEKGRLYSEYLRYQHGAEHAAWEREAYGRFLVESCIGPRTIEVQLRAGDRLAGVGILDRLGNALSSVYFYFDPAFARHSPGTYSALYEIDLARQWGMDYYYLGFYIRGCPSMSYKARFRPCEYKAPDDAVWRRVERQMPQPGNEPPMNTD